MRLFNKDKAELKDLNFPTLNNRSLLNRTLIFISQNNSSKTFNNISSEVFNNWQGNDLELELRGILLQILDDNYIEEHNTPAGFVYDPFYNITGKGKKFCNAPVWPFKNKPYTYDYVKRILDKIFTKYLPIIIACISLVIAFLAYLSKKT